MKTGFIVGVVVALIVIVGIVYAVNHSSSQNTASTGSNSYGSSSGSSVSENSGVAASMSSAGTSNTITITDSGFSPQKIEINQGDTVTWVNQGSSASWPASAMHPTHTVYPGSDIKKCGSSEQSGIFDACKGLANGESWSFTFNDKGTWGYHDHLSARHFGSIVVN